MKQPGDIIFIEATAHSPLYPGIECVVLEVSPDDGRITKMKAVKPNPILAKMGFLIEGEDYIAVEWNYSSN